MALLLAAVVVTAGVARGDDPKSAPAPDLQLVWTEGEISLDMSLTTTEITVTGTKLHYHRRYSGRNAGFPGTKPLDLDARIKDPRKLRDAIAALDKVPVKKVAAAPDDRAPYSGPYAEGCVTRGKVVRCGVRREGDSESAELKAIAAIRDVLADGLKLDPFGP